MLAWELQRFAQAKTERATPQRRREVRREGRIPRSADLTAAVGLLGVVAALRLLGGGVWSGWTTLLREGLGDVRPGEWTMNTVQAMLADQLWWFVRLAAPVLAVAVIFGGAAAFAQVGPVWVPKLMLPDLRRISPLEGFRRLWSIRTGVELLKSLLKLAVLGTIAVLYLEGALQSLRNLGAVDIPVVCSVVGSLCFRLAIAIAAGYLALAVADYMFQRLEFERSIRMSREEVREELKRMEGDPLIKAQLRQRRRQLAFRRMMQEVAKADVVVTNPVHYAVALVYDAKRMSAPTVVAKGQGVVAQRIKARAAEAGVPTVENPPLAQSLYRLVDIGDEVPADLYRAVAEVLAYAYRLRGRVPAQKTGKQT